MHAQIWTCVDLDQHTEFNIYMHIYVVSWHTVLKMRIRWCAECVLICPLTFLWHTVLKMRIRWCAECVLICLLTFLVLFLFAGSRHTRAAAVRSWFAGIPQVRKVVENWDTVNNLAQLALFSKCDLIFFARIQQVRQVDLLLGRHIILAVHCR